jgi:hypothetical protein
MFPFGSRLSPPSRLSRPVPPFLGETTKSYVYRLAVANHLHPDDLRAHLTGTRQHTPITLHGLAAATGRSPHILSHALPELCLGTLPDANPPLPAHVRRTVCWRCAIRRGAFIFAVVWQPAEVTLCPHHRIWLGPPVRGRHSGQYDVRDVPDILHAQRHHYRLTRRYGRQTVADAFTEATRITALWARHGFHSDRRKPLIHAFLGHTPLTGRLPSGDPRRSSPTPRPSTSPACSPCPAGATPPPDRRSASSDATSTSTSKSTTARKPTAMTRSSAGSRNATTRSPTRDMTDLSRYKRALPGCPQAARRTGCRQRCASSRFDQR